MRMYRGDLKPDLEVTCQNVVNKVAVPVDLSAATSIKMIGVKDGSVLFNRAISGPYSAVGVVTMPWQTADTLTVGYISVEVEVTWSGAKPQTFRPDTDVEIAADYA